jgi:glycosyltransferase involved in cell wall biosynthesis
MGHFRDEPAFEFAFLRVDARAPSSLRALQKIKYVRTAITTLIYWATLIVRVPRHDVLHVFAAAYYSYLLSAMPAVLLGKMLGKKVIVNYRSGEAEDHLTNWRWSALPTIRLADVVVVPSGYLVDVFARFGVTARPIFNIVELHRFRYRERHPLKPVFLTTRLLEPLYNVGCVLRAFSLIQQRFPEARLTVGGDGWQRAELEQLARKLGLRNTEFIGRVPFEQMPQLYDSADVYLTATDLDNMPGSVIECFACGLPVVTTDAGGVPYIVTHEKTGLLVARGDHVAMAAAAIRLIEDPKLALQISRGALEACRRYTWPSVRDGWLALYGALAEPSSRASAASAGRSEA